jgi:dsDNA-specific endonuclease/ATPase MutS2
MQCVRQRLWGQLALQRHNLQGLGEGVLRKTVENHLSGLKKKKLIQSFSNEYFQKYGFGATIVRI